MAGNLLMGISQDEHERAVFRSRKMYQMDWDSDVKTARENGIKIGEERGRLDGIKEGRKEEKKEVARLMLSIGESFSKIALVTGLTESDIRGLLS